MDVHELLTFLKRFTPTGAEIEIIEVKVFANGKDGVRTRVMVKYAEKERDHVLRWLDFNQKKLIEKMIYHDVLSYNERNEHGEIHNYWEMRYYVKLD